MWDVNLHLLQLLLVLSCPFMSFHVELECWWLRGKVFQKNNNELSSGVYIYRHEDDFMCFKDKQIQGYPQRMRFQKRMKGIYPIRIFIFMIAWNCKLVSFFKKSLNKPLKYYILGRRLSLNLELSYLVVFAVSFFVGNPAGLQIIQRKVKSMIY